MRDQDAVVPSDSLPDGLSGVPGYLMSVQRETRPEAKLVAVDIDGTLLTWGGKLYRSAERAIRRLIAHPDVELVLATGRSALSAAGVARRIGLTDGWAVCANGSVTIRLAPQLPDGWAVADLVTFDPGPAIRAIRQGFPQARLAAEDLRRGFMVTAAFPPGELDGLITVVSDDELAAQPVTRLVLRETELDPLAVGVIVEQLGLADVNYAVGWTGWVDFNPPGISKASALETLRTHLGIAPGQTVAIGDGSNDISMLRWAAHGVAMGGSLPDVIAAADHVTAPIGRRGLARVLDALG
ncbi:MAG: HAD family hydrolase [Bifidobacteriaceae bacterium]|jgi:hydroxymethylpyrimidine pyrophosphatase-like HAD family hydrolase|nr:HAD family hydrolase [Bifidobacteriaceae bacterium]